MALRKVNPGDTIRADDYNALVDAVERLTRVNGGAGVRVSRGSAGTTIALSEDPRRVSFEARIVGVYLGGVPLTKLQQEEAYNPLDLTYAARAYGRGETFEAFPEDIARMTGRPNTRGTVLVYPAREGEDCYLWRVVDGKGGNTVELEILTEEIKFVAKCTPIGGRPGGKAPGNGNDGMDGSDGPDGPGGPGTLGVSLSSGLPGETGGPGTPGAGPGSGSPGGLGTGVA